MSKVLSTPICAEKARALGLRVAQVSMFELVIRTHWLLLKEAKMTCFTTVDLAYYHDQQATTYIGTTYAAQMITARITVLHICDDEPMIGVWFSVCR
eukprot:6183627-Pleurochrysis_carterae.AAC.1